MIICVIVAAIVFLMLAEIILFIIGQIIYERSKNKSKLIKKIYHDKLKIHIPVEDKENFTFCKVCGKPIIYYKDSWKTLRGNN